MKPRSWFVSGLWVTGLFAVGHLSGFLMGAWASRHDPGMADLTRAMRAYRIHLMGFHPSMLDFREYFSLNFSILLAFAAGVGSSALALVPDPVRVVRALAPWYVGVFLALLATSIRFSIAQGVVTCPIIAALFAVAWAMARRSGVRDRI